MKYAIVKNGQVENLVEWDGESDFVVDGELVQATEEAQINGTWDGNVFHFEPPPQPPDLRPYDAKRREEYLRVIPIGDQLDAILKYLNVLSLEGQDLPQDLDDVVGKWLDVKQKFPKPE